MDLRGVEQITLTASPQLDQIADLGHHNTIGSHQLGSEVPLSAEHGQDRALTLLVSSFKWAYAASRMFGRHSLNLAKWTLVKTLICHI